MSFDEGFISSLPQEEPITEAISVERLQELLQVSPDEEQVSMAHWFAIDSELLTQEFHSPVRVFRIFASAGDPTQTYVKFYKAPGQGYTRERKEAVVMSLYEVPNFLVDVLTENPHNAYVLFEPPGTPLTKIRVSDLITALLHWPSDKVVQVAEGRSGVDTTFMDMRWSDLVALRRIEDTGTGVVIGVPELVELKDPDVSCGIGSILPEGLSENEQRVEEAFSVLEPEVQEVTDSQLEPPPPLTQFDFAVQASDYSLREDRDLIPEDPSEEELLATLAAAEPDVVIRDEELWARGYTL